jgi:Tol biopolymer transport system component
MAPEQIEGRDADTRSDIFAFGCVLYEMLTGQKAFSGKSEASLIGAIMHANPPSVSAAVPVSPPELDRLVQTCLAKDPEGRWQDLRDPLRELKWIRTSGLAPRVTASGSAKAVAVGSRAIAVSAGVVALAIVVGAWLITRSRAATDAPVWAGGPITLNIDNPEGTAPPNEQGAISPPTVSPDGRTVAWVSRGRDGSNIWIRRLDETTPRALAGTNGATYPFWSPDSRSLGFFAQATLKRTNVAGGSVQSLAATPLVALGGTWNAQDVIVFSTRYGLFQIPAGGGPVTQVAALDRSRQENSLRFPQFLPDGRHFLYVARSGRPEQNAAYVGSLDGKSVRLFPTLSNVIYAPPGYLLFVRDRTLVARRFDPATLAVGAETIDVAPNVGGNSITVLGFMSVSTNGVLAYTSTRQPQQALRWFDRQGRVLGTLVEGVAVDQFRIAPDGRRVVAAILDASAGTRSLWIYEAERPPVRLTFAGTHDWEPVWSPDGTRVAFGSYRDGPLNIYVKPVSGAGPDEPLLISDDQKDLSGDWSLDGKFLAYNLILDTNRSDVMAIPLTGADRKPVPIAATAAQENRARFSPDTRWIAYDSDESGRTEGLRATVPANWRQVAGVAVGWIPSGVAARRPRAVLSGIEQHADGSRGSSRSDVRAGASTTTVSDEPEPLRGRRRVRRVDRRQELSRRRSHSGRSGSTDHRRAQLAGAAETLICARIGKSGATDARPEARRPELHASRPRRQGHRARQVRRGLSRRRDVVREAAPQPDAARPRPRRRYPRGVGDARRQSDSHRRRSARPARRRARADQRAAVSGRADSGRRGDRRVDGRRGDRADRRPPRAVAVRHRSDRKPAADGRQRPNRRQRPGIRRRRRRPAPAARRPGRSFRR